MPNNEANCVLEQVVDGELITLHPVTKAECVQGLSERIGTEIQPTVQNLQTNINTKADSSALTTTDGRVENLQQQVNNIARLPEGSTTGDAEIVQARVGVDGTNYTNLKTRLDTEMTDVKEDLVPVNQGIKFIYGDVYASGESIINKKRLKTDKMYVFSENLLIHTDWRRYKIYLWVYDDISETGKTGKGWMINDFVIPANTYFKFVYTNNADEHDLSTEEKKTLVSCLQIVRATNIITGINNEYMPINIRYEFGDVLANWENAKTPNEKRARNRIEQIVELDVGDIIAISDTAHIRIYLYCKDDEDVVTKQGWINQSVYSVAQSGKYRFVIAQVDETNPPPSLSYLTDAIHVYRKNTEIGNIITNISNLEDSIAKINNNLDTYEGIGSLNLIARLGYKVYEQMYPPEQSIASYKEAYRQGFRIMLCDIRTTSDGVLICRHDGNLGGGTVKHQDGSDLSDAEKSQSVHSLSLAQLDDYDFGIYKGEKYAGTKILRLTEFLAFCKRTNSVPFIEFKEQGYNAAMFDKITSLVQLYGLEDRVMFSSHDINQLIDTSNRLKKSVSVLGFSMLTQSVIDDLNSIVNGEKALFLTSNDLSSYDVYKYQCAANGISVAYTEIRTIEEYEAVKGYIDYFKYVSVRWNLLKTIKDELLD